MNFAELLQTMRDAAGDYPDTMLDDFEAAHSAALTNSDAAYGELEAELAALKTELLAAQADNYKLMKALQTDAEPNEDSEPEADDAAEPDEEMSDIFEDGE